MQTMNARNPYLVRFIPFRQASFGLTILDKDKLYLMSGQSREKIDGKRSRRGITMLNKASRVGGQPMMLCWSHS